MTSKIQKILTTSGKAIRVTGLTLSFGYISFNFIAEPILCSGPSMEPTLRDRDIIIVERFSSVFIKKYKRGDIVVSRSPTSPKTLICKRVMGVAGDTVRNGFLSQQVIPRGHVWLVGDNTSQSTDSREWGPLPIGLILGRAVLKIWPINDFQVFSDDSKRSTK